MVEVFGREGVDQQPDAAHVEHRVLHGYLRRQHRPRLGGRHRHFRHEQDGAQPLRYGDGRRDEPFSVMDDDLAPPVERGGGVIRVSLDSRGQGEHSGVVQRPSQKLVRRDDARDSRSRTATQSATQRYLVCAGEPHAWRGLPSLLAGQPERPRNKVLRARRKLVASETVYLEPRRLRVDANGVPDVQRYAEAVEPRPHVRARRGRLHRHAACHAVPPCRSAEPNAIIHAANPRIGYNGKPEHSKRTCDGDLYQFVLMPPYFP